jgi:hypothetical protein
MQQPAEPEDVVALDDDRMDLEDYQPDPPQPTTSSAIESQAEDAPATSRFLVIIG